MVIEKTFEDKYNGEEALFNYQNAEQHELMVTITLAEYRSLLKSKIESEQRKEKLDWYEQYKRANEALEKVKALECENAALKSLLNGEEKETENG